MPKKTLHDVEIANKRVMIRVDFNVPQDKAGEISSDRRIRAALPTIQYCLDRGAGVILMSHLGRPKGDPTADAKLKMDRVAARLGELLPSVPVHKCDEVVGVSAAQMAGELKPGQILLLENLRFHDGEKDGDVEFAKQLASYADVYVNDAFGTCHRTDASMYAVPAQFATGNRVVGFLVAKELQVLEELLNNPKKPLVALMGGAKVSDKIGFVRAILQRADRLLIGGAMAYTFRKAKGENVGNSLVENDKLDLARELMDLAGDRLVLPLDTVIADQPNAAANTQIIEGDIPDGWEGMDIGPKTIAAYKQYLQQAATVVWNGPMGKFEDKPFENGTLSIAHALAEIDAITIVGGGESAEAVEKFDLADKISHVSTGGGAFLEYVEGKPFEALTQIDEK